MGHRLDTLLTEDEVIQDTLDESEGMNEAEQRAEEGPYRSRLMGFSRGNSDVLEKLAVGMYARGLSVRDIEDALCEATAALPWSGDSCVPPAAHAAAFTGTLGLDQPG